jgi:superfamily II DNA or RNA helicase
MIVLRDYQQSFYDKIIDALDKHSKVAGALATGGGKSVIIGALAQNLPGRTLILTHRAEILRQNEAWVDCGVLNAKENTVMMDSKIVVAMVQTLHARIKKYGIQYIGDFDNIILDEIQIQIFDKVVREYNAKKVIGLTATPVLMEKETRVIDKVEFQRTKTLAKQFDTLVQGCDSQELIDLGWLTQDYNIMLQLPDMDKLVSSDSAPDGYTKDSLDTVYSNQASISVLLNGYKKYCEGKKTLIFNSSTKINTVVLNAFKSKNLNVKSFDVVNEPEENPETGKPYTRNEIIEWFRSERDAILINTNVFTTGFDVDDVECVILNRATKSLSLFIQMVGRGSRITKQIYKDKFTVLDLGQNIYEHGRWSLPRDWQEHFTPKDWKRKIKEDILKTWNCSVCDAINTIGDVSCCICGAVKPVIEINGKTKKLKDGEFVEIGDFPIPKAKLILQYTKNKNEGTNFAFKLLETQIIEMFMHYDVSADFYKSNKQRFDKRVSDIYRPIYFAIIRSDFEGARKKLKTQINRLITKIEKMYAI